MSFSQRLIRLPAYASAIAIAGASQRAIHGARWGWDGVIVGLPLDPAMSAAEYRLILAGGSKRHAANPDGWTMDGAPVFRLSDYQRRERQRLLHRLALPGGFERKAHHNVGCDGGRNNILELVANQTSSSYTGVKYCAVGTGSSPSPVSSDTTLQVEFFRKAISVASVSSNEALLNTIFELSEGNGTYTEAGLFGSSPTQTASGATDSGVMYAHSLFGYTKTNAIQLAINYYIQLL